MSKRIATQVHKQASRLLRENYLKREPAWYQAVLDHPPLPLPAKAPSPRSEYDLPAAKATSSKHTKTSYMSAPTARPSPVEYIEDEIRRQFFRDHPFEAFRPATLVEGAEVEEEHPIRGAEWTRLSQRGRNPTPEDAVRFAANLHLHHKKDITDAYGMAVAQFRSLRAERDVARAIALKEAEFFGIPFGPSMVDITFEKEENALRSWRKSFEENAGEAAARKRWKAIVERGGAPGAWTRGQEYVRLWQEGVRPDYSPMLSEKMITPAGVVDRPADQVEAPAYNRKDPMGLATPQAVPARS